MVALSERRHQTAHQLTIAATAELNSLALTAQDLRCDFRAGTGDCGGQKNGWDRGVLFSANPGEAGAPAGQGGIRRRAFPSDAGLQMSAGQKDMVETVIFDEVDAGIGGEARSGGSQDSGATHHQVFCVTFPDRCSRHLAFSGSQADGAGTHPLLFSCLPLNNG